MGDDQIKQLAACTLPLPAQTGVNNTMNRTCFDNIGSDIQPYDVFGAITCANGVEYPSECAPCEVNARGLQLNFLINRNFYSQSSVEEWERQVFIKNVKSFNQALNNGYHNEMKGTMNGEEYNEVLIADI